MQIIIDLDGTICREMRQFSRCLAEPMPGAVDTVNALYDAGITMNDVNPDYVVVGEGRSYSLDTLTKATNLVMQGAKLIGANSDVSGPIENGIAPACRALIAPIEMATGKQAYFCGKPNPLMMRTGLKMLHCHSAEAVMVGDSSNDALAAQSAGMPVYLVTTGYNGSEPVDCWAKENGFNRVFGNIRGVIDSILNRPQG